jgi:predicted small secreted protein
MAKQGFKVAPAFTRALSGPLPEPTRGIDFTDSCRIFPVEVALLPSRFYEGNQMIRPALAVILLLSLSAALSSCGNTARGLAQDGRDTSHALDNATHRVLSAGSKK